MKKSIPEYNAMLAQLDAEIGLGPQPDDVTGLLRDGELETFDLGQFALNGQSKDMREKMLDDKYILGKLALLGQSTVLYAEPNGAKTLLTLWLLMDGITQGFINPADVYYVNSDDTHKGLVEKTELAENHHFKMLSDGYNGFKNQMLSEYLEKMIKTDTVSGKVIILDTLKKFTDLMNKEKSSVFMQVLRAFVLKGGSVIMLAHCNKHRGEDGKLVRAGTADVMDDTDCTYIMDKSVRNGQTTVTFENTKNRGDVVLKAVYSFERNTDGGQSYAELLATVRPVGDDEMKIAKQGELVANLLNVNSKIIHATLEAIEQGIVKKTELVTEVHAQTAASRLRVMKCLDSHTGDDWLNGHRWKCVKGDKNSTFYEALGFPTCGIGNLASILEN